MSPNSHQGLALQWCQYNLQRGFYLSVVESEGVEASNCPKIQACYWQALDALSMSDHQRLGVRKNASLEVIEKAYQQKCRKFKRKLVKSGAVSERIKLRQDSGLVLDAYIYMTRLKKRRHESIHDILDRHYKLVGDVV
jgi:hypothetical protein